MQPLAIIRLQGDGVVDREARVAPGQQELDAPLVDAAFPQKNSQDLMAEQCRRPSSTGCSRRWSRAKPRLRRPRSFHSAHRSWRRHASSPGAEPRPDSRFDASVCTWPPKLPTSAVERGQALEGNYLLAAGKGVALSRCFSTSPGRFNPKSETGRWITSCPSRCTRTLPSRAPCRSDP